MAHRVPWLVCLERTFCQHIELSESDSDPRNMKNVPEAYLSRRMNSFRDTRTLLRRDITAGSFTKRCCFRRIRIFRFLHGSSLSQHRMSRSVFESILQTSGPLVMLLSLLGQRLHSALILKRNFALIVSLFLLLNHTCWEGQKKPGLTVYSSDTSSCAAPTRYRIRARGVRGNCGYETRKRSEDRIT